MNNLDTNWYRAFDLLLADIDELGRNYSNNPKLILTETDLQCILFNRFQLVLTREAFRLRVHSETTFLDDKVENGGILRWKPDLVVFDEEELDVTKGTALYYRKGYTFWGSCLAFELKFNRIKSIRTFRKEWKIDIDKLAEIKTKHYRNGNEALHGAFVLFSRLSIPQKVEREIHDYASSRELEAICYGLESTDSRR